MNTQSLKQSPRITYWLLAKSSPAQPGAVWRPTFLPLANLWQKIRSKGCVTPPSNRI
jgi:hypothetical protein